MLPVKLKKCREKLITFKSKSVKIYRTVNRVYQKNLETGEKELKSEHPQFTLSYCLGTKRVLRKFASEAEARTEGELARTKIDNNDTAALDLSGGDRWTYVEANNILRKADFPDLTEDSLLLAINQYIEARKLLPKGVSLRDAVHEHVTRTSAIRESRMIPDLVEEFIELKAKADAFSLRGGASFWTMNSEQILTWIREHHEDTDIRALVDGVNNGNLQLRQQLALLVLQKTNGRLPLSVLVEFSECRWQRSR